MIKLSTTRTTAVKTQVLSISETEEKPDIKKCTQQQQNQCHHSLNYQHNLKIPNSKRLVIYWWHSIKKDTNKGNKRVKIKNR